LVGVLVAVAVLVGVFVAVGVLVGVLVAVGVLVGAGVSVGAGVLVGVGATPPAPIVTLAYSSTSRLSKVCTRTVVSSSGGGLIEKVILLGPGAASALRRTNNAPRASPPDSASVRILSSTVSVAPLPKPLELTGIIVDVATLAGRLMRTYPVAGIGAAVVNVIV
jgi:multisubunit Na+/H+ antiporter MnhC subunit